MATIVERGPGRTVQLQGTTTRVELWVVAQDQELKLLLVSPHAECGGSETGAGCLVLALLAQFGATTEFGFSEDARWVYALDSADGGWLHAIDLHTAELDFHYCLGVKPHTTVKFFRPDRARVGEYQVVVDVAGRRAGWLCLTRDWDGEPALAEPTEPALAEPTEPTLAEPAELDDLDADPEQSPELEAAFERWELERTAVHEVGKRTVQ